MCRHWRVDARTTAALGDDLPADSSAEQRGERIQASALRASDQERDAAVQSLRRHAAAGRLSIEELEERVGAALAARTRAQLEALLADLPDARLRVGSRGRSRAGAGTRGHLRTFVAVNVGLVVLWAVTGAGYFWPVWPMLWWGVGLALGGQLRPCARRRIPTQTNLGAGT
jgi:hypothetical protein